jgi:hypothetical protein
MQMGLILTEMCSEDHDTTQKFVQRGVELCLNLFEGPDTCIKCLEGSDTLQKFVKSDMIPGQNVFRGISHPDGLFMTQQNNVRTL